MIPYEAATAISSGDEIHMKSKSLSGNLFRSRSALFGMKSHKGFTLIELLVVVAIIGILASVVLAALGSARGKANEAKVKSEMSSMRAQAELYYIAHANEYATTNITDCTTGTTIFSDQSATSDSLYKLVTSAESANGTTGTLSCDATSSTWAVASSATPKWCVDSVGFSNSGSISSGKCAP